MAAWWRGFGDAILDSLVDRALGTNQDLRIATARVQEARALRTGTVLEAFPIVHADASYTKRVSSIDSTPFPLTRDQRERELYNAGFDATWELDLFGRVRRSIQASSAEIFPFTATEDLLHAAACYTAEHALMWKLWDLAGGNGDPEAFRRFADPTIRRQMVPVIQQARDKDAQAAEGSSIASRE